MSTLRYEGVYFDASVDPTRMSFRGPAIYLFWHEYISFPFFLRGHCNVAMLLSQHRDAEALARAARQMGFETVRGSSTRGGVSALRELFKRSQSQSLTLTPDGPKGPRRKLAPGCVFLSSRLQIPLVPMGLAYDRPRRIKRAWDQHAVPRLGSRACFLMDHAYKFPRIWSATTSNITGKSSSNGSTGSRRKANGWQSRTVVGKRSWSQGVNRSPWDLREIRWVNFGKNSPKDVDSRFFATYRSIGLTQRKQEMSSHINIVSIIRIIPPQEWPESFRVD